MKITCIACEGRPMPPNDPCYVCGGSGEIRELVLPDAIAQARAEGYAAAVEAAAKMAEEGSTPFALHTNTGAMMFRACTEKIAAAIRTLTAPSGKEGEKRAHAWDGWICTECGATRATLTSDNADAS